MPDNNDQASRVKDPRRMSDSTIDPRSFSDRVKQAMVGRREPVYEPRAAIFSELGEGSVGADFESLPVSPPRVFALPLGHSVINTQYPIGSSQPVMLVTMEVPERIPYIGKRVSIVLVNNGPNIAFIGGMQETTTAGLGFPVAVNGSLSLDHGVSGELWAICAAGNTADIRILMEMAPVLTNDAWESWETS